MDDIKQVPFYSYEADMARMERINKRLCILSAVFGCIAVMMLVYRRR